MVYKYSSYHVPVTQVRICFSMSPVDSLTLNCDGWVCGSASGTFSYNWWKECFSLRIL